MNTKNPLLARLWHHVSGAIARGEGQAIVEIPAPHVVAHAVNNRFAVLDTQTGRIVATRPTMAAARKTRDTLDSRYGAARYVAKTISLT